MDKLGENKIMLANIDWQSDQHGMWIPISKDFGDVYFCRENGLKESQYVFLQHNHLPQRLAALSDYQTFVIGEIGFGTGLNLLATWQLWQQIRPNNHSRLHFITTEKFPLSHADLKLALTSWQDLSYFTEQLLDNYPVPLAGCHRLNFAQDRLCVDIWFGDATDSLSQMTGQAKMDAWFLDGFAPACNEALWSEKLFAEIARLSKKNTSLSTFSVANVVKKNLQQHGFALTKVKGFAKKREMLTASFQPTPSDDPSPLPSSFVPKHPRKQSNRQTTWQLPKINPQNQPLKIAVIGAGVAGLSTALALANRGHQVTIFDHNRPLSGASGNPRALLAPKLTSLSRMPNNLHAIGYLAGVRYYQMLTKQHQLPIYQKTQSLDLLAYNRLCLSEMTDFPSNFAQLFSKEQSQALACMDVGQAIYLPDSGLIDTHLFAHVVLSHQSIQFQSQNLQSVQQLSDKIQLNFEKHQPTFDHVVLCMALATQHFIPNLRLFNYSRGQVSWFLVDQVANFPKVPLKYGGYGAIFHHNGQNYWLMGASFVRDTLDITPTQIEHQHNLEQLLDVLPSLADKMPTIQTWHAKAGIRTQTVDYLPLVGQVLNEYQDQSRIWTFSALGSKGYAYAPICSEVLADLMTGNIVPLSKNMLQRLNPNRNVLKIKKNLSSKLN